MPAPLQGPAGEAEHQLRLHWLRWRHPVRHQALCAWLARRAQWQTPAG